MAPVLELPLSVENANHNTFNTAFHKDDRGADANGMLVVLPAHTCTMLALFRSVTLGSETNRAMFWGELLVHGGPIAPGGGIPTPVPRRRYPSPCPEQRGLSCVPVNACGTEIVQIVNPAPCNCRRRYPQRF